MKKNNIISQFHYIPIYKFSLYKEKKLKLSNTEQYFNNTVSLPIFYGLKKEQQRYIANKIIKYINK
jgi:dTDP-4-amino-4,6-dideoxygalactose transaminase